MSWIVKREYYKYLLGDLDSGKVTAAHLSGPVERYDGEMCLRLVLKPGFEKLTAPQLRFLGLWLIEASDEFKNELEDADNE